MKTPRIHPFSLLAGSAATAGLFLLTSLQGADERGIHGDVREFLSHVSMVDLPDGQGGFLRTVRITGLNVQVVNGLGATNGNPAQPNALSRDLTEVNGLGNLIVGYNELGNDFVDDRRGSHNIVAGNYNSYQSFGGVVAARDCTISAPFANVTGGFSNRALGTFSAVSGGCCSSAVNTYSSVSGGYGGWASGPSSSISGGYAGTASGYGSSVSGGYINTATANWSSVSGGASRAATGSADWVAGTLFEDD